MNKIKYYCAAGISLMLVLSGCGSAADVPAKTSFESEVITDNTHSDSMPSDATAAYTETTLGETSVPSEPFDPAGGITDEMYERALFNEGGRERLAAAMRKASRGESVTVGVIGGSITQGTAASNSALCYASLFFEWWRGKFPDCEINTVNAGIGGTDSYLGVNRADQQLLSYDPDAVIVEFSVNDADKIMNKFSYDSLVRKILSYKTDPAVILLFTTQENGTSLQDTHRQIGEAYDLPMISYREAVYPLVSEGALDWKTISPDNIHPNDAGHSIIGQLLSRYLDSVYDDLDNIPEEIPEFDSEPLTLDYYKDAVMYFPSTLEAVSEEGFVTGTNSVYPDKFPENWVAESGGSISFELDCRTCGIFYLKTVDGKGGKYEVLVDGERKAFIDSDFKGGWGNYGETKSVLLTGETAHHTVEIKPVEGSENTSMTILGIMAS